MKKIKILYVISTLRACGPVNVLYNIVKFCDMNKFDIFILTLSVANQNDRKDEFKKIGVHVIELDLSRIGMELWGKQKLKKCIAEVYPDIIHTHCFRSSLYMEDYVEDYVVCTTIHNYPHKDFVYAYGNLLGKYICRKYIKCIKSFNYLVSCSKAISDELKKVYNLDTNYIRNGMIKSI